MAKYEKLEEEISRLKQEVITENIHFLRLAETNAFF